MQQYSISNGQIPSPPHNHEFINNNVGFREYHAQHTQLMFSPKNTISWEQKYTNPQLLALQKEEEAIFGKPQSKSMQVSQSYQKNYKNNSINSIRNQNHPQIPNNQDTHQIIKIQKIHSDQENQQHQNLQPILTNYQHQQFNTDKNQPPLGNLSSENEPNINIYQQSENKTQENKTQENKPQENKPEENKPQENKPQESKLQENKVEINNNNTQNSIKQVNEFSKLLEMSDEQLKAYLTQLMPDLAENVKDMTRQQLVQVIKDVLQDVSQKNIENVQSLNNNQNCTSKEIISNLGYENQKLIETALKVYPQLKQYINTMSKSEIEDLLKEVLEEDNKKDYSSHKSQNHDGQMMNYGYGTKIPRMYDQNQMPKRGRPRMYRSYPEDMKMIQKPKNFKKPTCISQIIQNLIIQLPSLQNEIRKMCVNEIQQLYNQVMEQKRILDLRKKNNSPQQNNLVTQEDKKINNPIQGANIRQNNLQGDTSIYQCQQYQNNYAPNDNENYILKKDQINLKKSIKQNSYQDNKQCRKQVQGRSTEQNDNIHKNQVNLDGKCQKKVKSRTIVIVHTTYNNSQNMEFGNSFEQITKKLLKIFQKS